MSNLSFLTNPSNSAKRRQRLSLARKKGSHTKEEWEEMKRFFEYTCCICSGGSGLINVEKDHIIPIYQGGSDSINNLQPLCALCNCRKGYKNTDGRHALSMLLNKDLPEHYKNPY